MQDPHLQERALELDGDPASRVLGGSVNLLFHPRAQVLAHASSWDGERRFEVSASQELRRIFSLHLQLPKSDVTTRTAKRLAMSAPSLEQKPPGKVATYLSGDNTCL